MPKRYREYAPALLMLAVGGLLALVLLVQWLYYHSREADLKKRLADKVEVHMQAASGEQERYELPGLDDYAATIERPLFMESRRPGDVAEPEQNTAPVQKLPLNAKLMGIVFAPDQKPLGLFVDARGKYKRLHKEDLIDGWKVVELQADKAVMEQDDTRQDLKLLKAKPKKPPTPPPPGAQPPDGQTPEPAPPEDGSNPDDPNNPEIPPEPVDSEQPMPEESVDEIPAQPEEVPNEE